MLGLLVVFFLLVYDISTGLSSELYKIVPKHIDIGLKKNRLKEWEGQH